MASRSFRNNNCGNLRYSAGNIGGPYPIVLQFQGTDDGDNYAVFPTVAKGCAALTSLLAKNYGEMTVGDAMKKYAPSDDGNDPEKYAKVICAWAGITPLRKIGDLSPNLFFELCKAITRFEGWKE